MRFEELGRHLAVASEKEAIALVQADRNFWNVVSIHAPNISRAHLRGAKRVHYGVVVQSVKNVLFAATID